MNTSERGIEVFANNPHVDHIAFYPSNTVANDKLDEYWEWAKKEYRADRFINFTETIEVQLAVHPKDLDSYNLPYEELKARCNKNYYEHSAKVAGVTLSNYLPELFFDKEEERRAKKRLNFKKFNILWCLIGSGVNKFYPWSPKIIDEIASLPNTNIITVGDNRCRDIENAISSSITKLSGRMPMRDSMALTKYVDLVVAPDTGVLHASGCFNTPKIGLLGHTTKENITKHFINDYSIEAQCSCAPCFSMIYDHNIQCPVDPQTGAAKCMFEGIYPSVVIKKIIEVYNKSRKNRR